MSFIVWLRLKLYKNIHKNHTICQFPLEDLKINFQSILQHDSSYMNLAICIQLFIIKNMSSEEANTKKIEETQYFRQNIKKVFSSVHNYVHFIKTLYQKVPVWEPNRHEKRCEPANLVCRWFTPKLCTFWIKRSINIWISNIHKSSKFQRSIPVNITFYI